MALAERADLVARLSLKDEFSGKLRGAQKSLSGFSAATKNTQASLGKMGQNLSRLATVGAVAFSGAIVGAVKVAGDFEASLNTINTIARENATGLNQIGDAIRKVARDTGTPLEELTTGYYDLLSAGIKAADATDVLTAANRLAIGGLATTAETVDLLTTAINTYGGDASKAGEYADIFAKTVERGKVTAADLAAVFAQIGPLAAASNIEIEEIAAGFAQMTAAGVPAAEAATYMKSAILALTRTTGPLEALQKQTGKNYLSIAGSKGLVVALEQLRTDAAKAGVPLIDLVGRQEALLAILQTTGPNLADYNANLAAMGDASGTAAEQMAERQKGLNFQLARLKALATDAGITIGSKLIPKLVPLVEKLNEFIGTNQDKIGQFGDKLGQAFENIAGVAGKIDWSSIGAGLEITGRAAKGLVDAFLALPPDLQKLAVAAIAINKVGGGIVTSGIKDIIGLTLRGASGTGGLGGIGVQKVFVVNMGAGMGGAPTGGGEGLGLISSFIATAGIGAALATLADEIQRLPTQIQTAQDTADALRAGDSAGAIADTNSFLDQFNGLPIFGTIAGLLKTGFNNNPDIAEVTKSLDALKGKQADDTALTTALQDAANNKLDQISRHTAIPPKLTVNLSTKVTVNDSSTVRITTTNTSGSGGTSGTSKIAT